MSLYSTPPIIDIKGGGVAVGWEDRRSAGFDLG